MLIGVKMITNTAWDMARAAKAYVEAQKAELKPIVKAEKRKAKDVFLQAAEMQAGLKKK